MKSLCLLLAHASLHRGPTLVLLVVAFALGLLLRRTAPRAGRGLLVSTGAGGVLLVAFCVVAMVKPGSPRTAIIVVDKTSQAEEGRLVATSRWGLVDQWHIVGVDEHVALAREHLGDPVKRAQPLVLEVECRTLFGSHVVHREYALRDPGHFVESDLEYAARAIALQMAFDVEQEQERAPASTGMKMTAWQFEDLPSALYASVGTREPGAQSAAALFASNSWELVSHETRAYALPDAASPSERAAYGRVRDAHALWARTDGPLESPFASDAATLATTDEH